jgi:D-alanyl-D-alanine carboxypeptidase/D-alanyl-D-alanine-endopeptidase (penicillin-binding protein 4)
VKRPILRIALCLLLATVTPLRVGAGEAESAALDALLADPRLRGARIGALVVDLWSGETLASHEAERALVPASNQKILISIAALEHWGPSHRFATRLYAAGAEDGVVDGPLWVEARGDPSLVSERLWSLAEEVRLRGIRAIPDGIAVDATYFGDSGHHPDWLPLSQRAYEAPTSAFAANYSTFRLEVSAAAAAGELARLDLAPRTDYFRLRAEARTVNGRGQLRLGITPLSDATGERIQMAGSVGLGRRESLWRSVAFPERYAASVLRQQLEAHGIRVGPGIRFGSRPPDTPELLRFEGAALAELVASLNKYSNNFIAEQLFKCMGAERYGPPASWEKGAQALEAWLAEREMADPHTIVADGSGLSARNRISPRTLVALLRRGAMDPDSGPELLASLPLGGLDGTLRDRDLADRSGVRAKTGHLRAAAALSGVLPAADGRALVFSLIVNGARRGPEDVDAALDDLVSALGAPRERQRAGAGGD